MHAIISIPFPPFYYILVTVNYSLCSFMWRLTTVCVIMCYHILFVLAVCFVHPTEFFASCFVTDEHFCTALLLYVLKIVPKPLTKYDIELSIPLYAPLLRRRLQGNLNWRHDFLASYFLTGGKWTHTLARTCPSSTLWISSLRHFGFWFGSHVDFVLEVSINLISLICAISNYIHHLAFNPFCCLLIVPEFRSDNSCILCFQPCKNAGKDRFRATKLCLTHWKCLLLLFVRAFDEIVCLHSHY